MLAAQKPAQKPTRQNIRRAAIMSAARDAFFEEGYEGASMSTIAARLGGSKGTLYNYFKNKEELFEALIRDECSMTAEGAFEAMNDDDGVEQTLLHTAQFFLGRLMSEDSRRLFQLVVAEAARSPRIGRLFYDAGPRRGREGLGAYLARAKARGEINPPDPYDAADLFLSLCKGPMHLLYILHLAPQPERREIDDQAAEAVRIFMAAYGSAAKR